MGVYDFSQLPTVVDSYVKALQVGIDAAVIAIATDGLNAIVDATPVDTTLAVSNWQMQPYTPATGTVGPHVAGSVKGSGAGSARAISKARGRGAIAGYKGPDKSIYITNNVPYIGVLEHGDSKHRPSGMVSKGLQAMSLRARSIRIEVKG